MRFVTGVWFRLSDRCVCWSCFVRSSFLRISWSRHATSPMIDSDYRELQEKEDSIQLPPYTRLQEQWWEELRCVNCGKRRSRSYCRWHELEPFKFPRYGICSRSHCIPIRLSSVQSLYELPAARSPVTSTQPILDFNRGWTTNYFSSPTGH
jgi:hypothetical protein